jgi:hypothetical protein
MNKRQLRKDLFAARQAALSEGLEVERLRAQAVQDFERWGTEKLRLEAEVERLRKEVGLGHMGR